MTMKAVWIGSALLCLAASAQAVQDCELNGEGVNPSNGNTTAGKTGLMRCKDRDSGQMMREQEIKNGKFMGLVRQYDAGKLKNEYSENDRGNRQGLYRSYGADGKLLREETYDNGDNTGLSRSNWPGGQLRRVAFYVPPEGERAHAEFTERGQLQSLRCGDKPMLAPLADDTRWCGFAGTPAPVEFFGSRGVLTARSTYVAGKRMRHETFNDNGNPSYQAEITEKTRVERYFNTAGVKRRELTARPGSKGWSRDSELEFSDKGTLVRERRWADDTLALDQTYYLNGQLRSKAEYTGTGAAAAMLTTDYYGSGKVAATGRFDVSRRNRELPVGSFLRFNEAGRVVGEATYDDKGSVNRERVWDDEGKLLRDDAVFEDGSRKAFAR